MKLHDLRPARGAHTARTRVGRGIAGGKGKTAGRGTKGQKARAGGSIPPWFEGGQTPIHIRIPKLRGFKNRGRIEYEIVNLGRIAQLVELGVLELGEMPGAAPSRTGKSAPITINQEILRATGLVSTLNKPLKVLGHGEVATALFVVADKFSRTAVAKIEAAGGSVQVLEAPVDPTAALASEREAVPGRPPSRASIRAEAARAALAARPARGTRPAAPAASAPAPMPAASAAASAAPTSAPASSKRSAAESSPAAAASRPATPKARPPQPAPGDAPRRARRSPAGDDTGGTA